MSSRLWRALSVCVAVATCMLDVFSVASSQASGPVDVPPLRATTGPSDRLEITSDEQWSEGDLIFLRGNVDIRHRDIVLQADRVELNQTTKDAMAEGRVVLQQGEQRLVGDRLELNLETRLGCMWHAWGYAESDVFFSAKEAHKTGDKRYDLRSAELTSCNQPLPQWRLKASRAHYETDRYVRMWNARLEVLGVPILYIPFFQYPVRQQRSTGFLFPAVGSHNVRGFYVSNGFFWAMGRSYDATVLHDWYKGSGSDLTTEFRYVPSENANGVVSANHVFDKELGNSSAYRLTHNQRIGTTWRLGATIDYTSSDAAERQYSRDIDRITRRSRSSHAYLERNWSRYSLGVEGIHTVSFGAAGREGTRYQLPSMSFGVRDSRLLGPLYGAFDIGAAHLGQRANDEVPTAQYQRVDVLPSLRMPMNPFPWLEIVPNVAHRLTYYTKTIPVATEAITAGSPIAAAVDESGLDSDGFLRRFSAAGVRVVGPTFQRIFLTPDSSYSDKYKHVIQPELSYEYVTSDEDALRAPRFDGIDSLGFSDVHRVSALIRNRLLSRRASVGGVRTPHELLLFELGSTYDFNLLEGDRLLPLAGNLRFVPSDAWTLTYNFAIDTGGLYVQSQTLRSSYRSDSVYTDLSFIRSRSEAAVFNEHVRSAASFRLFGGRLQLSGAMSYDILNENLSELASNLVYRTQCCGFGVGYNRRDFGERSDREVRFSVSLKNIGTVFDYTFGDNQL